MIVNTFYRLTGAQRPRARRSPGAQHPRAKRSPGAQRPRARETWRAKDLLLSRAKRVIKSFDVFWLCSDNLSFPKNKTLKVQDFVGVITDITEFAKV